jgi:ATP-dependent Clp protease ATP-binding subunit ClpB
MEKHSVARLIGAPPGYVGYDEGGQLTEQVRRKPYSVILFDEVEKAHPDVFNALLQVLDDGRLTDGQGRTVDFKNTVIVMTSNLGSQLIQSMVGSKYDAIKAAVMAEVKNHFRPEFVNRIDEMVRFRELTRDDLTRIVDIQLRHLADRLAARRISLEVSDAAKHKLGELGYDPAYGARPLKRVLQKEVADRLARAVLEGTLPDGGNAVVDVDPAGELLVSAT